jgi:hypothetical protein
MFLLVMKGLFRVRRRSFLSVILATWSTRLPRLPRLLSLEVKLTVLSRLIWSVPELIVGPLPVVVFLRLLVLPRLVDLAILGCDFSSVLRVLLSFLD